MKYHKDIYKAAAPIVGTIKASHSVSRHFGVAGSRKIGERLSVLRPDGTLESLTASAFDAEVKRATPAGIHLRQPEVAVGEVREVRVTGGDWAGTIVSVHHEKFIVVPFRFERAGVVLVLDTPASEPFVGPITSEALLRCGCECTDAQLVRQEACNALPAGADASAVFAELESTLAAIRAKWPTVTDAEWRGIRDG